jgi:putative tricarboxylic transport membrane protein
MFNLKTLLGASVIGATSLALVSPTLADYPDQPIRVVHTSSPGAPIDVMMRNLAQHMEEIAGVPVVVEGRPGGSGQVAISYLKGQPADGYTIHTDATGITATLQLPGAAHDWRDLTPLYRVQLDPFALYVKRNGDYSSLDDLLADMRERGGEIRIGGYGIGSPHQLSTLAMADQAGVDVRWVQYNSGADAVADVMSGDLEAAMSNIAIYGRFQDRTQVLAHTAEERLDAYPDVPAFAEEGLDLTRYHWRGTFVHGDTPDEIVDALYDIMDQAVQTEGFQEYLKETSTLSGRMPREEFAALLEAQAESDRRVLIQLGMIEDNE